MYIHVIQRIIYIYIDICIYNHILSHMFTDIKISIYNVYICLLISLYHQKSPPFASPKKLRKKRLRWEPCGLVQMEAMRLGTLPIVAPTGGLKDTVEAGIPGGGMELQSIG